MSETTKVKKLNQVIVISDLAKFEETYKEYYPIINNYLRTKIQNAEEREDVVCEIFEKVAHYFDSYNVKKAKIKTWLFTIVENHIVDKYRLNQKYSSTINESDLVYSDGESSFDYVGNDKADADIDNKELRRKIRKAIRSLKPIEKRIAILRLVKEYEYNEIAEILDMPLNSVKVTILRAKENLQALLKNEYALL